MGLVKPVILLLLLLVLSLPVASITSRFSPYVVEAESEYTYALAIVKAVVAAIGKEQIYGTINLKIPRYIVVDRENEIQALFKRSGCWPGSGIAFYVSAEYLTKDGIEKVTLGTLRFSTTCESPLEQSATLKLLLPLALYKRLASNFIKIFVGKFDMLGVTVLESKLESNIPAESYVVYGVPEVRVRVFDVTEGYLALGLSEVKSFTIAVTSENAPILVQRVELVNVPSCVRVYVNTPLPLNIGVNETRKIEIVIKGVSPGVGVVGIALTYYTGAETKDLYLYVPVLVEEDRIYGLLREYENALKEIEAKVRLLEDRLGLSIDSAVALSQKLNSLINALESLNASYTGVLSKVEDLVDTYSTRLSEEFNSIRSKLSAVSMNVSRLSNELKKLQAELTLHGNKLFTLSDDVSKLSDGLNELRTKTGMLESGVNSLSEKLSLLEEATNMLETDISKLFYAVVSIATLLLVLSVLVIYYSRKSWVGS